MARAALRPRTLFRPRAAKSEEPATPTKPKKETAKPATPRKTAEKTGKTGKTGKAGNAGKAGKAGKGDKGAAAKKSSHAERPLPFPLRLLAMLFAFAFMVAFAVVLARLTLEPSPASESLVHSNLRPGDSLRAYLDQPALRDAAKQIGGNVLLGVPFGILVPVVAPRARGVLRVLLLTAAVMLLVEFAQGALVTGRAFDIDDVILNTTGALVGYLLLGRRVSRAVHARERHL
ncbi:VanZ family protein [Streptomyces sp. NBC_01235]|uniref:VanZ family protein n=1 Tax=Streptomyces sp. NBC_01235 TaxID=2903788 RepID=UPI002E14EABA|nr:VanZ family protein [Streptomyces sp. NBC_01235]